MSQVLETLFGSKARARIIKLFLLNNETDFDTSEITTKTLLRAGEVRKELNALQKVKFIKGRTKKGKKFYSVNQDFNFYPELRNLITKSNIYPECKSLKRISSIGRVKLASTSGVFINYPKSKADMILVVDDVSRSRLNSVMASIEAEVGKEIAYFLMNSDEFKYRVNMLDKFIMEFFEGPHEDIINKFQDLIRKVIINRS